MHVETTVWPSAGGVVVDADVTPSDEIVALVRTDGADYAVGKDWRTRLRGPVPWWYPKIRGVGGDRLVIVDGRMRRDETNAFVFSREGTLLHSFMARDAVQDVLVMGPRVVVSYFDEGVFGDDERSQEGIFVFDLDGSPLFGYRSQFGDKAIEIADCYALAPDGADAVWFFPYTDFPIVRLDVARREQTVFPAASKLHGAHGLAASAEVVFFHGSYRDRDAVQSWKVGTDVVTRVGEWDGRLRGVHGGRFLGVVGQEVMVITLTGARAAD